MASKAADKVTAKEPTFNEVFSAIAEKTQEVMQAYLGNQALRTQLESDQVSESFASHQQLFQNAMHDPSVILNAQRDWLGAMSAWMTAGKQWLAGNGGVSYPLKDRRFRADAWQNNTYYQALSQAYLLVCQQVMQLMESVKQTNEDADAERLAFLAERFLEACSPSNFLFTNPEVIDITLKTHGQNLIDGLENLKGDIARAGVNFQISMTDNDAFEIGKNVATTAGQVIFQNDVIQIIQYTPTTEAVHPTPLLIVPPWINKYYVLDLSEKNSLVKYCVDQGMTTFMISWVNPTRAHRHLDFDDYIQQGPMTALDVVTKQCGVSQVNALSYCNGGTLTAAMLAYLAKIKDKRVKSITYLTTMIDFSDPGEVSLFIDEEQVQSLERKMAKAGYLHGSYVSTTFSTLRAKDLIWNYYVSNYLKGEKPAAFDILFWNEDGIHLAEKIYTTYLRRFYLQNDLIKPNGFEVNGTPIDVADITIPSYFISTEKDHIAPWKTVFNGFMRHGGEKVFVLSESGHIAAIVNPADNKKYGYYIGDATTGDADQWLEAAKFEQLSWWSHWMKWLKSHAGKAAKPKPNGTKPPYKAIEPAPGSYVKVTLAEAAAAV